jgi:hypothetical protein
MRLFDASLDICYNPWGYRDFAMLMNRYDDSGFGWAFYSDIERRVKYPDNLEPATIAEFLVHDNDIDGREVVRRGNVQVSAAWYQHTIEADQRRLVNREKNIRSSQAAKRNSVGIPDISSPAKKAALARKIAEKEDEFQASLARHRARQSRAKEGSAQGTTPPAASSSTSIAPLVSSEPAAQPSSLPQSLSTVASPATLSSLGSPYTAIHPPSPAMSVGSMSVDHDNISAADRALLAESEHSFGYLNIEGSGDIEADAEGEDENMEEAEGTTPKQ